MKKRIEKIEVAKNLGNFYYTGILLEIDDNWVEIRTTRNEVLRFRKEQIMQRREITGEETDGKDQKVHINR